MSTTNKNMDYIQILSIMRATSKNALSVTTLLYTLLKSTAVVDKSLGALYTEVNEVRGILDALESDLNRLFNTDAKLVRLRADSFWEIFGNAVLDTQRTVATLEETLRTLGPASKATMLLKKAVLQIQLDLSADDITNIRTYIHTHFTNLQLALAIVNPDIVINGIGPKLSGVAPRLELLRAMIFRLTMASSPTPKEQLSQGKKPQVERKDRIIDDINTMLERLMEMVAKLDIMHIADTSDDIPEGFQNPDIMDHTQQIMHYARAIFTTTGKQPNSSIFGGLSDVTRKARTEQWIHDRSYRGEASGSTDTSSSPIATPQTTIAGSWAGGQGDWSDEPDPEPDDEFDIEVVQRMFARGLQEYTEAHFKEAIQFLETGIDRATRLSQARQTSLQLEKMQLHIVSSHVEIDLRRAFMMIREGYLMESERVFHSILRQQPSNNDEDRRRRLHAASGLAHINLWRLRLKDAEGWCHKSVAGWNRLVGKGHPFYRISLRLMQAIYKAKDDLVTASILSEIMTDLPAEARSLSQVDEELKFFISPGYDASEAQRKGVVYREKCARAENLANESRQRRGEPILQLVNSSCLYHPVVDREHQLRAMFISDRKVLAPCCQWMETSYI